MCPTWVRGHCHSLPWSCSRLTPSGHAGPRQRHIDPSTGLCRARDRFNDLLAASDVVVVCCPLTPQTRDLFHDAAFEAMKDTALIVNVTRGAIINNEALARALEGGKIRGAGLDVTSPEPLPADHALWRQKNVIITPHTAGASQTRVHRNVARFVANLRRYREGAALEGEIDKLKGF